MHTETIRAIRRAHVDTLMSKMKNEEYFDHYGTNVKIVAWEAGTKLYTPTFFGQPLEFRHKFKLSNGDEITIDIPMEAMDKYNIWLDRK